MNSLTNPSTKFTLSLDGLSGDSIYSQVMGAAQRGIGDSGGYTYWEIGQLCRSGRLGETNFWTNGQSILNPWALK
jgi:hypothetical protein